MLRVVRLVRRGSVQTRKYLHFLRMLTLTSHSSDECAHRTTNSNRCRSPYPQHPSILLLHLLQHAHCYYLRWSMLVLRQVLPPILLDLDLHSNRIRMSLFQMLVHELIYSTTRTVIVYSLPHICEYTPDKFTLTLCIATGNVVQPRHITVDLLHCVTKSECAVAAS